MFSVSAFWQVSFQGLEPDLANLEHPVPLPPPPPTVLPQPCQRQTLIDCRIWIIVIPNDDALRCPSARSARTMDACDARDRGTSKPISVRASHAPQCDLSSGSPL